MGQAGEGRVGRWRLSGNQNLTSGTWLQVLREDGGASLHMAFSFHGGAVWFPATLRKGHCFPSDPSGRNRISLVASSFLLPLQDANANPASSLWDRIPRPCVTGIQWSLLLNGPLHSLMATWPLTVSSSYLRFLGWGFCVVSLFLSFYFL